MTKAEAGEIGSWADMCQRMSIDPWHDGVLSHRLIELISLGLNAACTNPNADGTRRHIRRALAAGATPEMMAVLKLRVAHGVQACNLAIPLPAQRLAASASADLVT